MSNTPIKPVDQAGEPAPTENVIKGNFPHDNISEEEHQRSLMVAVKQQADSPPDTWKNWYTDPDTWYASIAARHGITPKMFAELVKVEREAKLKEREVDLKDREQKLAEARLDEQRAERLRKTENASRREQQRIEDAAKKKVEEKSDAFADIIKLPSDQHEAKLADLAKKLDEDVTALRAEFADYCAAETPSISSEPSEWDVEAWPEPVSTVVVLEELIARINQHVKAKPHEVLAIALWVMMCWVHEAAAHYSLYLVATAPKDDCGKTTLIIEVIGRLTPKSFASGSDPTLASIFRTADREKPTMLFDNVDTLFQRKPEVTELFLNGWTRGIKYSRVERIAGEWLTVSYDPFCPKACSLIGTNLPRPLLGRCLLIELWPLKSGEQVAEVKPFDQELMDAFKTLRRKLLRWSNDSASTLKDAEPLFPAGFTNRPRSNAKLLLAIAELAGDELAKQARTALDKLLREKREPSWLELLLQELWIILSEEGCKSVTSKQLVARLTADPTSEWCEYGHGGRGHRVTEREVAALLRKLHIRPHPIGKARVRGYHRQDFLDKEIFEHFLGRDPLIRSPETQPNKSAPKKTKKSRRKK